jgi:hypothetical protein
VPGVLVVHDRQWQRPFLCRVRTRGSVRVVDVVDSRLRLPDGDKLLRHRRHGLRVVPFVGQGVPRQRQRPRERHRVPRDACAGPVDVVDG